MLTVAFHTGSNYLKKFLVSGIDGKDCRVYAAENEEAAISKWALETGRDVKEASIRPFRTSADTIAREIKPRPPMENKENKKTSKSLREE
jgi:hypothetical protein